MEIFDLSSNLYAVHAVLVFRFIVGSSVGRVMRSAVLHDHNSASADALRQHAHHMITTRPAEKYGDI